MTVRMLLSHNYTLAESSLAAVVVPLSRAEFAAVFEVSDLSARPIDHPHWMVELRFDAQQWTPAAIGTRCVEVLQTFRSTQVPGIRSEQVIGDGIYTAMALGGLKSTPVTSSHPLALQTGEWGVDMVETVDPEAFLTMIGWERTVSARPSETYFYQSLQGLD
ncbi:MAG: DUF2656 family protein [Cyanobacteria bacterium J06632_22]